MHFMEVCMKKIIITLLSLLVVLSVVACGGNDTDTNTNTNTNTNSTNTNTSTDTSSNTNTESNTNTNTNTGTTSGTNTNTNTDSDEVVTPPAPDYNSTTVEENLKTELEVFDREDTFGVGGTMDDYTTETVINVADVASNAKYTIFTGGTYRLTGTSNDGQIYIKAKDQDVVIVLDNVSITNKSFAAPAIYAEDCASVTVILVGDNYLADSSTNDGEGAVLRVRSCNLTIDGKGTLNVTANAKHGISNTKEITINGGTFNITAPNQGIYGKLGLTINAGRFNIDAGKSGLKSGDSEDGAVGYMNIKSGSFDITSASNGLNCNGPVAIDDGRIVISSTGGNAIDASDNVTILGGALIFDSYKSAIATDKDVTIGGNANIKMTTTGNGISANDVTVDTTGLIFIKTTPTYELVNAETPADEKIFVFVEGSYVEYDSTIHPVDALQYIRRQCRGIEADGTLSITNGIIGIDSYEDAMNVGTADISSGKLIVNSTKDAFDGATVTIGSNATITVLGSEKGINATTVTINGGLISINALTDAIKANITTINGGKTYLFDKIDAGTNGATVVNGGTLLMISTTNNMQTTTGLAKYISTVVENKNIAFAGKWIQINSGGNTITLELPKNYTEKMAVYYTSGSMGADLIISIGTVDEEGNFTAEKTELYQ